MQDISIQMNLCGQTILLNPVLSFCRAVEGTMTIIVSVPKTISSRVCPYNLLIYDPKILLDIENIWKQLKEQCYLKVRQAPISAEIFWWIWPRIDCKQKHKKWWDYHGGNPGCLGTKGKWCLLSWVWPTVAWAVFFSLLSSLSSSLLQVWISFLFWCKFISSSMFSTDCCSSHPAKECVEMQKLSIKNDSLEYLGKLTLAIVVLRCLLLPETAPQVVHVFINSLKNLMHSHSLHLRNCWNNLL